MGVCSKYGDKLRWRKQPVIKMWQEINVFLQVLTGMNKWVKAFKYLGSALYSREIKYRFKAWNLGYYSVQRRLSLRMSKKSKIRIYKTILRYLLYGPNVCTFQCSLQLSSEDAELVRKVLQLYPCVIHRKVSRFRTLAS